MKRIETNPSATPYHGPIIILRCLYMNMMGQWFESVLEQELGGVNKKSTILPASSLLVKLFRVGN